MSYKFRFIAINGMEETEIDADDIRLVCPDGSTFDLCPRRSDGEVTLYAYGQLIIQPIASNCVRVFDKRHGK